MIHSNIACFIFIFWQNYSYCLFETYESQIIELMCKHVVTRMNIIRSCFLNITSFCGVQVDLYVSIWSVSYSLEKNQGSGGGVTSFRNQARTVHVLCMLISRLIGVIS